MVLRQSLATMESIVGSKTQPALSNIQTKICKIHKAFLPVAKHLGDKHLPMEQGLVNRKLLANFWLNLVNATK
jgi:hypothetical protein